MSIDRSKRAGTQMYCRVREGAKERRRSNYCLLARNRINTALSVVALIAAGRQLRQLEYSAEHQKENDEIKRRCKLGACVLRLVQTDLTAGEEAQRCVWKEPATQQHCPFVLLLLGMSIDPVRWALALYGPFRWRDWRWRRAVCSYYTRDG
jgi:hypothetical protein